MLSHLFVAGVVSLASATSAEMNAAAAPFRVVARSGDEVRVDIGSDEARSASLREATVLTGSGALPATVVRSERTCTHLCGEEEEDDGTCHFEAVLRASGSVHAAIAVLPGRPVIGRIAPMSAAADQPIGREADWIDADPIMMDGSTYRWTRFPDGIYLASEHLGREFYAPPIPLATCTVRSVPPFTMLDCGSAQLLYEGKQGIAVSFEDYGRSTVEPLLRFRLDGKDAVLMHLGLKAEVVVALLVKENGQWRLRFRRADYPLLC
jgi:hypothetical protein